MSAKEYFDIFKTLPILISTYIVGFLAMIIIIPIFISQNYIKNSVDFLFIFPDIWKLILDSIPEGHSFFLYLGLILLPIVFGISYLGLYYAVGEPLIIKLSRICANFFNRFYEIGPFKIIIALFSQWKKKEARWLYSCNMIDSLKGGEAYENQSVYCFRDWFLSEEGKGWYDQYYWHFFRSKTCGLLAFLLLIFITLFIFLYWPFEQPLLFFLIHSPDVFPELLSLIFGVLMVLTMPFFLLQYAISEHFFSNAIAFDGTVYHFCAALFLLLLELVLLRDFVLSKLDFLLVEKAAWEQYGITKHYEKCTGRKKKKVKVDTSITLVEEKDLSHFHPSGSRWIGP